MKPPASRPAREPSVCDDLYKKPQLLVVFVSSKMRGGAFAQERAAAIEAIDATGFAKAWAWERDAMAGPYSSEKECVARARNADLLVLLVGRDLTGITLQEYQSATKNGVHCSILIQEGVRRLKATRDFINTERSDAAITMNFSSISELKSHITNALYQCAVRSTRLENGRRRQRRAKGKR